MRLDGGEIRVPEFLLELLSMPGPARRRPGGRSLEIVTAIGGALGLAGDGWHEVIAANEALVVPAATVEYDVTGEPGAHAFIASLP
jgi:hypothetical protein